MLYIILVIVFGGIIGGIAGAVMKLLPLDSTEIIELDAKKRRQLLLRLCVHAFLGIVAALVVPLFLELAAPGQTGGLVDQMLADDPQNLESNLLIFGGFCVVVALSAQSFLRSISERLLKEAREDAKQAKKVAKSAIAEAQVAREDAEDANTRAEEAEEVVDLIQKHPEGENQSVSKDELSVLSAMAKHDADDPTADDITELTNMPKERTLALMEALGAKGFVKAIPNGPNEPVWRIRKWGRLRILRENGLSQEQTNLLDAFLKTDERRPTIPQLAKQVSRDAAAVRTDLSEMRKVGLVAKSSSELNGWRIRTWGREYLRDMSD